MILAGGLRQLNLVETLVRPDFLEGRFPGASLVLDSVARPLEFVRFLFVRQRLLESVVVGVFAETGGEGIRYFILITLILVGMIGYYTSEDSCEFFLKILKDGEYDSDYDY